MKKYITIFIIMMLVLVSCNKAEPDDTVKVWMYRYSGESGGTYDIMNLIETEITNYAEENKIKVEILNYKEDELSLEDYKLKRNLALEHGNADIIIGDMYGNMAQMSEYAGDYTKLENYENIFDNFKGQCCIPIGSIMRSILLDNKVLKSYSIECNR